MASIKMGTEQLVPHLFRTEFRKITAMLCRNFGLEYLGDSEDIASECFLAALETWPYKGVPANPSAWLFRVAKNKAINRLRREKSRREGEEGERRREEGEGGEVEVYMELPRVQDDELRMLFAVCHPALSAESQVALALRVCCGFGIDEIAGALLAGKEAVNKRLYRAKEKIRTEGIQLELPEGAELINRLQNVLITIYLLFTEGYYSETNNELIREELCFEAMRLAYSLTELKETNQPEVQALMALFCFHASRFPARKSATGNWVLYSEQDTSLWNRELITKGAQYLHRASVGQYVSRYHLEAAIAYWHTHQVDSPEKWESILELYDQLMKQYPSQVAALNRVYAVYKVHGSELAIESAEKLRLIKSPYYFMLLAELYWEQDNLHARISLNKALELAKTDADRNFIHKRLLSFNYEE
ncbi:RNA polymerase sigma factor [Flavihumibacter sp. UBA7668]|uniref:RNA polymerase sigma factor n=1 Tax=Flavihumibacter sp. UBA7668 TaxID=1946542 RepID=UPI0025C216E6|nr:sigma-70 family RNA polymerase sigma factor [Flavihumibacter sp. UBA7668]